MVQCKLMKKVFFKHNILFKRIQTLMLLFFLKKKNPKEPNQNNETKVNQTIMGNYIAKLNQRVNLEKKKTIII